MQITHDLVHAAAHMEGVCGHAPATKIRGNFLPVVFGKQEDSDSLADPME